MTFDYSRRDLLHVVSRNECETDGCRTACRYLGKGNILKCWIESSKEFSIFVCIKHMLCYSESRWLFFSAAE